MKNFDTVEDYLSRKEHWNFIKYAWIIQHIVGKFDTVLDVGCALGYLVYKLRGYGINAIGIDKDNRFLEFQHPNLPDNCFNCVDVSKEKLSLRVPVDCVCALDVLEHVSPDRENIFVENIQDFSKRYIIIGVAVHDKEDDLIITSDEVDPTHINVRKRGYWIKKFVDYGVFSVAENETAFFDSFMTAGGTVKCDNEYFVLRRKGF